MDDLREQLATEGQMGTATIAYVWPLIEAALLRERSDTAEKIARDIRYLFEHPLYSTPAAREALYQAERRALARSGGGGTPEPLVGHEYDTESPASKWCPGPTLQESIYGEIRAERARAHAKHGNTSMEGLPVTDMTRLSVLVEEVGEVAREFNEARHRARPGLLPQAKREASIDLAALRKELVQTAAMAAAWADALAAPEQGEANGH